MRGAFGLVSLLVAVAIGFWLFTKNADNTLKSSKGARDEAQQISGRGADGTPAGETITTEPEDKGGNLNDLLVKSLVPGGAMESYYGLKVGDQITQIGNYDVRANNDVEMARGMLVQEGYEKHQPLTVLRNSQAITLPAQAGAPPLPAPSASTQAPVSPAPAAPASQAAPPPTRRGLQDQLDLIRRPQQDQ
jgi:hypothetical protein